MARSSPATTVAAAIQLDSVTKVYGKDSSAVTALDRVSIVIAPGTFTAVMGPSGSGKSTFLHCAAGLDRPTSGSVFLGSVGADLRKLSETALTKLRRERIGFIFQSFNLLAALNVRQNITLPLRLAGHRVNRGYLEEILSRVGLSDRSKHRPAQLSGGQQQRVAIARALIAKPEVVFADEPTGALDTGTAREILMLLRQTVDAMGQTVVMVTHDPVAASYADHVVFLADGRIVEIAARLSADEVAERMTHLGGRA